MEAQDDKRKYKRDKKELESVCISSSDFKVTLMSED